MLRTVLTDDMWNQLIVIMKSNGCRIHSNSRQVMEAIIWKLRVGAPWRDIPPNFCPWTTAFNRFNRWAKKGLWSNFFLLYEEKLIKSGYSPTEVQYELINMQVELGVATKEQLANLGEELQPKYILPPMRMETRLILKSLGVKFTTAKLQKNLLNPVQKQEPTSLLTKDMTPKTFDKKLRKKK